MMKGFVFRDSTPSSLDPCSQTFQVIDLNSVQILIQYCHNNIHWPHFRHFGSLMLMRKYLKFRGAPRATLELWFKRWILQWSINKCKNNPDLPWILIIDYEKRVRLKTPCLGGMNVPNFTPKKNFRKKIQNRWEIYHLKVAKFW